MTSGSLTKKLQYTHFRVDQSKVAFYPDLFKTDSLGFQTEKAHSVEVEYITFQKLS